MMMQMLFPGIFIPFIELTKTISYFTIARWEYKSFAPISNLGKYGFIEPDKGFFDFNTPHVISIWFIFIGIFIIFLVASIIVIKRNIIAKNHNYLFLDDNKNKLFNTKVSKKK